MWASSTRSSHIANASQGDARRSSRPLNTWNSIQTGRVKPLTAFLANLLLRVCRPLSIAAARPGCNALFCAIPTERPGPVRPHGRPRVRVGGHQPGPSPAAPARCPRRNSVAGRPGPDRYRGRAGRCRAEPAALRYRLLHVAARITADSDGCSSVSTPPGRGAASSPPRSPASTPCPSRSPDRRHLPDHPQRTDPDTPTTAPAGSVLVACSLVGPGQGARTRRAGSMISRLNRRQISVQVSAINPRWCRVLSAFGGGEHGQ
ncbi:MAG: hypothetical protein JWP64_3999 [Pseudonocardia sp.]|jgi:hypothetical protein|nr:hypothetical protein [Pseudonocardia sp.]